MKKLVCGLATTALLLSFNIAKADSDDCVIQGTIVPTSQIEQAVKTLGYTPVKEYFESDVKLNDDCIYKVKAKDASGQKWKLYFNPTTGQLISKKMDD